jgi:UDP-N-acetylmuramate--alanine ligase
MFRGALFKDFRRFHFVGAGGVGMSGIAELLLKEGFKVSGSDRARSAVTDRLESLGAVIYEGHRAENVGDADALVYSAAIDAGNPELRAAIGKGIPAVRRSEALAECMRMKYGIGIAGTHGKTTVTAMTAHVLIEGGLDPTALAGGMTKALGGSNARYGGGDFIVVEADEYDRTFLKLSPVVAVLTTLDVDHLDIYRDLEDIENAFVEFANKPPFYGFVLYCADDENLARISERVRGRIITYGLCDSADYRAKVVMKDEARTTFEIIRRGETIAEATIGMPGEHNVRNALAAAASGIELGVEPVTAARALSTFGGVERRFEVKRQGEIMVVDDYAHHPTEVKAALQAAKERAKGRTIAVFQPHLYSRTKDFYREFAEAFLAADVFICADVYPAREEPIPGVTGEIIVNEATRLGHPNARYVADKEALPEAIAETARPGDLVMTVGAGDVWKYGERYIEKLESENNEV